MLFCVISQHYFKILVSNVGYLKRILRDLTISYDSTLHYFNSITVLNSVIYNNKKQVAVVAFSEIVSG